MYYADREIIIQASRQFSMLEEEIENRDEKLTSFWQSFFTMYDFNAPATYLPPQNFAPTDRELFDTESRIIERIANQRTAVIIGRCGSYILRNHPNHLSIFLHAARSFRKSRVQEIYQVPENTAEKMVLQSDKDRAEYFRTVTGNDWIDTRQYDLCLDTEKIGLENSLEVIIQFISYFQKTESRADH
jgi:cytidylate kinase